MSSSHTAVVCKSKCWRFKRNSLMDKPAAGKRGLRRLSILFSPVTSKMQFFHRERELSYHLFLVISEGSARCTWCLTWQSWGYRHFRTLRKNHRLSMVIVASLPNRRSPHSEIIACTSFTAEWISRRECVGNEALGTSFYSVCRVNATVCYVERLATPTAAHNSPLG